MTSKARIAIDVWSDYVCPFCYLELPALQQLQKDFGDQVEVTWHAFELRPEPVPTLDPGGEYLRDTWARAVYPMAADRGMQLRLPPVQPRSRKAFEAVAHARGLGRFDAMHAALFRAFFEDGKDIGSVPVLLDIAAAIGVDPHLLREALDNGRHTDEVIQDELRAAELGISGVPLTLVRATGDSLSDALVLRGAVPYQSLHAAVTRVIV